MFGHFCPPKVQFDGAEGVDVVPDTGEQALRKKWCIWLCCSTQTAVGVTSTPQAWYSLMPLTSATCLGIGVFTLMRPATLRPSPGAISVVSQRWTSLMTFFLLPRVFRAVCITERAQFIALGSPAFWVKWTPMYIYQSIQDLIEHVSSYQHWNSRVAFCLFRQPRRGMVSIHTRQLRINLNIASIRALRTSSATQSQKVIQWMNRLVWKVFIPVLRSDGWRHTFWVQQGNGTESVHHDQTLIWFSN